MKIRIELEGDERGANPLSFAKAVIDFYHPKEIRTEEELRFAHNAVVEVAEHLLIAEKYVEV